MGGGVDMTAICKGRIHSFETLGALDGPGLRCVVFFQGCPLRCRYCHNPDTWDFSAGTEMTVPEVLRRVSKSVPYFSSAGGVTLSGGEPFAQAKFAAEILRCCKQEGIHTAVDTSGFYLDGDVEQALDHTDMILLDIKHVDPTRHKELVGQEQGRSLAFLERVGQRGIRTWVRQVIVPGWNDTDQDMRALAKLVKGISCVEKVELLPYHTMARDKWAKLGMEYPLGDVPGPSVKQVKYLQEVVDSVLAS